MARSVALRKLVAGVGTGLVVTISIALRNTMPLSNVLRCLLSALGSVALFTSVALALAIHRSYPEKHDEPKDMGRLFTEGPYELCRHPFYLFTMLSQISIPLTLTSFAGLLVALILIPAWILLIKGEERELIEYWGDRYLEYARKVPTLIPNVRKVLLRLLSRNR